MTETRSLLSHRLFRWLGLGAAVVVLLTLLASYIGYGEIAVMLAPQKRPQPSTKPVVQAAKALFWETFEAGDYQQLPKLQSQLTAAYIYHPRDPETALLLAHSHLWQIAESTRLAVLEPTITNALILAEAYFLEAQRLAPFDHRIPGWLGGVQLAIGSIHQDEKRLRQGYFTLKDGVRAFPEFNHFALAFALSQLPANDPRYGDAIEHMWLNYELCLGRAVDRQNPPMPDFSQAAPTQGPSRLCRNLPKAPHNIEGFLLAMGDMLTKANRPALATKLYANARAVPGYDTWPYRAELEQRIATVEQRAAAFHDSDPDNDPVILARAAISCVVCHQR